MRTLRSVLVLSGFMLFVALGAYSAEPSQADARITAATRLRLLTAPQLQPLDIHVVTHDGRVTLFGNVISEVHRSDAERIASAVDGVIGVLNELRVVSDNPEQGTPLTDAIIKERVQSALVSDALLRGSGVTVNSVVDGVVVLGGSAASIDAHLRAVERARRVPGVVQVTSDVKANDAFDTGVVDPSAKPGSDASQPEHKYQTDLWLASAVRQRLLAESSVPTEDVRVDAFDGVVTLVGSVPDDIARRAAENAAREVEGVRQVENRLSIKPESSEKKVERDPRSLLEEVNKAIAAEASARGVKVTVVDDAVTLRGVVANAADRLAIERAAHGVAGVSSVTNEIVVRSSP